MTAWGGGGLRFFPVQTIPTIFFRNPIHAQPMGTHPSRRACFLFPETHRAPEMGSPGSGAESARPKAHGQNPPFSTLRSPFWAPMRQFFPGRCPHTPDRCWARHSQPCGSSQVSAWGHCDDDWVADQSPAQRGLPLSPASLPARPESQSSASASADGSPSPLARVARVGGAEGTAFTPARGQGMGFHLSGNMKMMTFLGIVQDEARKWRKRATQYREGNSFDNTGKEIHVWQFSTISVRLHKNLICVFPIFCECPFWPFLALLSPCGNGVNQTPNFNQSVLCNSLILDFL